MAKENKYEKILIKDYEDEWDLIDKIDNIHTHLKGSDGYNGISIIGKSDFIYTIFNILTIEYGYAIGSIDFSRDYFDDEYDAEYCLTIFDNDMVCINKCYMDNGKPYILEGAMFMYQEDCEQKLIDHALDCDAKVILFGLESDDEPDCENCEFSADCPTFTTAKKNEKTPSEKNPEPKVTESPAKNSDVAIHYSEGDDGKMHGFSAAKSDDGCYHSYSYYTTDELTKDTVNEMLKEFGF